MKVHDVAGLARSSRVVFGGRVKASNVGEAQNRERIVRIGTSVVTALALVGFTLAAHAQEMTGWQARRALAANTGMAYVYPSRGRFLKVEPGSVRVTSTGFEFDAAFRKEPASHFNVAFADLRGARLACAGSKLCELAIGAEKKLPPSVPRLMWNDELTKWGCSSACQEQGAQFIAALSRLVAPASDSANGQNDFPALAAAWRANTTKPPLPDAVRVRSLLAEDAVRDKKPEAALKYYQQGLDLYPLWPQGWFNSALICAELHDYNSAAEFMQKYLLLLPDASDARQVRDQLEMWKIKAQEK